MCVLFYSILVTGPTSTAAVCHIYCKGGEDNVTDCDIKLGCHCENVVGVSCSKYNLLTKLLSCCNHVIH